ncbi:MAG TPA: hypothetical protein VME19_21145 [Streptosporangiaceae bacterium]|nr:hypothetical protein [Streptosporangiaceae bacterium]
MTRDRDVAALDARAHGYDEGRLGQMHHAVTAVSPEPPRENETQAAGPSPPAS